MTRTVKLVMFDFDGTLVDSQSVIVAAMSEAFLAAGLAPPEPADVRRIVGLRLETAVARLLPDGMEGRADALSDGYRKAFFEVRRRPDHDEPLFPGALEALHALDRPDVLLGIATGKGRRGLVHVLEHHGLVERFATLKTADDGPGKPHPAILEQAMAELGVDPGDTVMVGDTVFDVQMARNAGVEAIGVAWGYHEAEELTAAGAVCVIETFAALLPLLSITEPGGLRGK